ncbi:MAG: site-specific integrase [bacterium]|nr:site-specific integrase [bacterium]
MAVRKLKGSWTVDFQFRCERCRRVSPQNTREGALAYEAHLRGLLTRGEPLPSNSKADNEAKVISLEVFVEEWMTNYVRVNNKPSEQGNKRHALHKHILPYFKGFQLKGITAQSIEAFKAKKQSEGLKAKSINNLVAILRKCLVTAQDWGALEIVPRIKLLKAEAPKYKALNRQDEERLLQAIDDPFWKAVILTALKTGMRFSELVGLEWGDVDLERQILCVRRANVRGHIGTPKNNRTRYIPLTKELVGALQTIWHPGGLAFPFQGSWLGYETGRKHLAAYCHKAGIQVVAWHALRHTFASRLVSEGAPLKAVQDLMGHSTINMTMRYSHLNQTDLRKAVSLLERGPDLDLVPVWCQPEEVSIEKLFSKLSS